MSQEDYGDILVIIPVHNEAETIAPIIHSLQQQGLHQIRVVDNGSTDSSATAAKQAGAEVIFAPELGYGNACWHGLQNLPDSVEWLLFCDGDGSDDLSQLPEFLALREQYDFILGDRMTHHAATLTPVQKFGNHLTTTLIQWGWGYSYQDLGPLRLIRRTGLEGMEMRDRGFGWTVEMQVRALDLNLPIKEIPVNYLPRQAGQSKISGTIRGSLQAGRIILSTLGHLYLEKHPWLNPLCLWLSAILLLIGAILTRPYGDFLQPNTVPLFWRGIAIMGLGFIISWGVRSLSGLWFWGIAITTRLILLTMFPGDDIWRYIWEGTIQTLGFSPYEYPPNAPELMTYRFPWWDLINHPDTSAIYPPITQWGFRLLATLSPTVWCFKLAFIAADLATCALLSRRFGYAATLLYAWNPLILYSFAGGGHYDSWLILPLVAAWLQWDTPQPRPLWSSFFIGLSIAVKWVSLPLLAFLTWRGWRNTNLKTALFIIILGLLPILLTAIPFCTGGSCPLIPTQSTFVTHGRSAELFPYFLGKIWPLTQTVNWIYALPLAVVLVGLLWTMRQFWRFSELYFFALLVLSPIIHAWYFTWVIPFAVVSRNWGTRFISLSAFVYFALQYRKSVGDLSWLLTDTERWWLWTPLGVGWLLSWCIPRSKRDS